MKYRVIKNYRDKETRVPHGVGSIVEVSDERAAEITDKYLELIEEPKELEAPTGSESPEEQKEAAEEPKKTSGRRKKQDNE